ncbi:uncharacterized protein K02A2.6-like [Neodiprion virginianus]|uniref:uncharacterized protein K02A2.6-like n=1 Tax=Neodiprion virginianus TaxID=2961670 RepID=UPI001EE778CA|nr:uncharacterized protein K02A2.6-like [Neodiprion virginianus]
MRCEDDCIDWETIENAVYSGKTTWIYALTKVELVEICKRRKLECVCAAVRGIYYVEQHCGGQESSITANTGVSGSVHRDSGDCETETPLSLTYKALKEKLESHYQPKPNQQLQRFSFRACKQGSNESIRDFMTALRSLALKCQFQTNETNSQLKDQLITGVYNQRVRYELSKASADESLENLLRLAKTVELADAKAASLGTPNVVNTGLTPDNNTTVAQDADIHTIQTGRNRTATNRGRGNFYGQASRRGWSAPQGGGRGTQRSQNQQSQGAGRTAGSERICFCCGGTNHIKANCSLQNKYCSECGNQGHIFKMCRRAGRGGQTRNQNYVGDGETAETQEHLREEFSEDEERFASDFWPVRESGYIQVEVEKNYVKSKELLYVVSEGSWPIMGRIWLQAFGMWPLVFSNDPREHINSTVAQTGDDDVTKRKQITCQLQKEFPGVFAAGIGAFTKGELKLTLIEGATPKFLQPRKMPWALRDKVENELARLQQLAIISPVEYSDWGTPIVLVLKSNGTLRLCGDYKVTLNKYLEVDRCPLPRVEEVLEKLRGGKIFTKLDLSEAYQQLPLTQESQKLVVISTHIGLFKYHRLPYGVATGPGSFQRVMTSLLLGIPGTIVFIDDILITAATLEIHTDRVREVLKRLNEGGLRLKFEKCKFFKNEVCYLGFRINEEGIRRLEAKIKSVKDAPKPKDVSELRSFLGSINYYGRFIENMAQKLRALYECLEKDKFEWTEVCDKTFEKIKRELVSDKILVHFDPQKQTVLTCDASPYGISAVLAHRDEEDSAALARIFDPSKAIPEIAAARLQKWALILALFEYTIKHIQGKKNYADWLSRLPLPKTKDDAKEFPILQNTMYTHVNCVKDYDFATLDWKAACRVCLETRKSPPKIALTPWAWPTTPWHRIHADFLGPFNGKTVLVIVDSHSKWPEAIIMQSMSESHTIKAFEEVFARHGYPAHLITDNYSTFVGKAFQSLLKVGGVKTQYNATVLSGYKWSGEEFSPPMPPHKGLQ